MFLHLQLQVGITYVNDCMYKTDSHSYQVQMNIKIAGVMKA